MGSILQYFFLLSFFLILDAVPQSMACNGFCKARHPYQPFSANTKRLNRIKLSASSFSPIQFYTPKLSVPQFTKDHPANSELFGRIRNIVAFPKEFRPYKHPPIFGRRQYYQLIARYVDGQYFNKSGTWSDYFTRLTFKNGPGSHFISQLAEMETTGRTSAYDGRADIPGSTWYERYRQNLKPLADYISLMNPTRSSSLLLCAFWTSLSNQMDDGELIPDAENTCIKATLAWSKILLAHHAYHCDPKCVDNHDKEERVFIWNHKKRWKPTHEHFTAGFSVAMAYDILFSRMKKDERKIIRSALSLLVLKRSVWVPEDSDNTSGENSVLQIVSHTAMQHSSLYLTNLAIEKEKDFDGYTTRVLRHNKARGFNHELDVRFTSLIKSYLKYAFYEDGATAEDGNSYFLGLREGALALVAIQRRGHNVMDTPHFRNIIHNAAQMFEPWPCGRLIGHASGGGHGYATFLGLFKYMYPKGELPSLLWRLRMGNFVNRAPCRIEWRQSLQQLLYLGGEHSSNVSSADELPKKFRAHIPLSIYSPKRGLLIMRNSYSAQSTYVHFDVRTDAVFSIQKSSDRGTFTYACLGKPWIDDHPWRKHRHSTDHSILHIDGIAQGNFPPSGKMTQTYDDGNMVIANADLTYAYNVEWEWGAGEHTEGTSEIMTDMGIKKIRTHFSEREMNSMHKLGWGFNNTYPNDVSVFKTLAGRRIMQGKVRYAYKRLLRKDNLVHVKRSVGLIRSKYSAGLFFVADFVSGNGGEEEHIFEQYHVLHRSVSVESSSYCRGKYCRIVLRSGNQQISMISISLSPMDFRVEEVVGIKRVILQTKGVRDAIWTVFDTHEEKFQITRRGDGVKMSIGNRKYRLMVGDDESVHRVVAQKRMPLVLKTSMLESITNHLRKKGKVNGEYEYQAAFSFRAVSNRTHIDVISTCQGTAARTNIVILDCGAEEDSVSRYHSCGCVASKRRGKACSAGSEQVRWRGKLESGRGYILVLSAGRVAGEKNGIEERPQVSVRHYAMKA